MFWVVYFAAALCSYCCVEGLIRSSLQISSHTCSAVQELRSFSCAAVFAEVLSCLLPPPLKASVINPDSFVPCRDDDDDDDNGDDDHDDGGKVNAISPPQDQKSPRPCKQQKRRTGIPAL